jgi:hypothetical protein
MPIGLSTEPLGRFVVLTITDPYTIDEWRLAVIALLEVRVYRERRAVLVDRRHCEPPSSAFVGEMTAFMAGHKRQLSGTMAAVVVSDDGAFGMSRMTEIKSSVENPDIAICTFRRYEEAEAWLTGRSSPSQAAS